MRRIQLQQNAWMVAQTFKYKSFANDDKNPNQSAGIHTELLFKAMWEASDVLTTRQIEVWHDPKRRFMTCDAPVLVPFRRNVRPSLLAAQYIIWPVSPQRVVALSHDAIREKAVIREATGELVGMVRNSIEQGRERMIFATEGQRDRLPASKKFRRRAQARLRCSDRKPSGAYVPPLDVAKSSPKPLPHSQTWPCALRASISRPPICSRSLDDWCGAPYGRAVSPSVPGARMP